jgi:hypothetical protein
LAAKTAVAESASTISAISGLRRRFTMFILPCQFSRDYPDPGQMSAFECVRRIERSSRGTVRVNIPSSGSAQPQNATNGNGRRPIADVLAGCLREVVRPRTADGRTLRRGTASPHRSAR